MLFIFSSLKKKNQKITTAMSTNHTIVGAKWCGYSQKQAESLGCTGDGDGPIECGATHEGGTPVTFVWCQGDKGQPMNQDHPACKVKTQGYPTWTTENNGTYQANGKIKGFTDGCKVDGLNRGPEGLRCGEREAAIGICATAQQAVKAHMDAPEGKALQAQLQAEATKLGKDMETYMEANKDNMQELQTKMAQAKADMQTHMKSLEDQSRLPQLKNELNKHIESVQKVQECKNAMEKAQPAFSTIKGM